MVQKMDFSIRPATKNDAAKIRWLIYRAGINPFGLKWPRFVIAAGDDGQFLGCAQLKPHGDGSIELASLAVEEHFRGKGIARALIEHLLTDCPRPLYLTCRAELGPLYQRFGFRSVGMSDALSPRYHRLRKIFDIFHRLQGRERGLIMRLD